MELLREIRPLIKSTVPHSLLHVSAEIIKRVRMGIHLDLSIFFKGERAEQGQDKNMEEKQPQTHCFRNVVDAKGRQM